MITLITGKNPKSEIIPIFVSCEEMADLSSGV
jgi:hypothetical protein